MAHDSSGLKGILELSFFYDLFQRIIGSRRMKSVLMREYFKLGNSEHMLDIGCGTGEMLYFLPTQAGYVGIDFNERYIRSARATHSSRGEFILGDLSTHNFGRQRFDRICIVGVLHHLEDEQVSSMLQKVSHLLNPAGKLVCIENVYTDQLSSFERLLLKMDRGKNIRTQDGYEAILKKQFASLTTEFRTDLLRIPYTHVIFTCSSPSAADH